MTRSGEQQELAGWTVFLAEDEYLVALDTARMLELAGARVIGPAPKVAKALAIIECEPLIDAAVLDIDLNGDAIYPVAEVLIKRSVPIVFATGYDVSAILPAFAGTTRCEKPLEAHRLIRALKQARHGPAGG